MCLLEKVNQQKFGIATHQCHLCWPTQRCSKTFICWCQSVWPGFLGNRAQTSCSLAQPESSRPDNVQIWGKQRLNCEGWETGLTSPWCETKPSPSLKNLYRMHTASSRRLRSLRLLSQVLVKMQDGPLRRDAVVLHGEVQTNTAYICNAAWVGETEAERALLNSIFLAVAVF